MFNLRLKGLTSLNNILKVRYNSLKLTSNVNTSSTILNYYKNTENFTKPPKSQRIFKEPHIEDANYLLRVKNDPDVFGVGAFEEQPDPDDIKEEEFLTHKPSGRRLSTKQYADIIKDLLKQRKIKEAIDVLENRMLKEDGVKPEDYHFNLLIGACGRVGYTKKAFSLYNNMKKRGYKAHASTYTSLFNACANSPWPEDGLSRARELREIMVEKLHEPNDSNYNAMIKAFGRCGDIKMSFSIVDEMIKKNFVIKDDTLNFLLQACINDKEAGFRHALLVWRKFVDKNIPPTIFTYNLMLRSIRDCGLGDLEVTTDVIQKLLPEGDRFLQLTAREIDVSDNYSGGSNEPTSSDDNEIVKPTDCNVLQNIRPNLMLRTPHLGNLISLSEVKLPEDRLLLVGGARDFLENMEENNCKPDIKTFSQLLDTVPNTLVAEDEILKQLKKSGVNPDLDFYNMLIKRRSLRGDTEMAYNVLQTIKSSRFKPNLITYGVLAIACKNMEQGICLINEMEQHKYRVNIQILGAMLKQACYYLNFNYGMELMDICNKENINPNKEFINHLDHLRRRCKHLYDEKDTSTSTQKNIREFRKKYTNWKQEVFVEEEEHPWQQFRQPVETDVSHFKDKEQSSRFKQRHKSLFRQKTSIKYVDPNYMENRRKLKKKNNRKEDSKQIEM